MIGCDNEGCAIQWFHIYCLDLPEIPSGEWLCPVYVCMNDVCSLQCMVTETHFSIHQSKGTTD